MSHLLLLAALAPLFVQADAPLAAGTQLTFRGSVEPGSETAAAGRKTFDLTLWIAAQNETGAEVLWLLEERGRGEFPWPGRFGRVNLDRRWRAAGPGPSLLYDRGDGRSVVPIPLPFLVEEQPLAAGAKFQDGKFELSVEKPSKTADRASWKVGVRDPFGPRRTLWVDQASPLVLGLSEKVTMGRGDEYQLKLEWLTSERLPEGQYSAVSKAFEKLTALSGKLGLKAQAEEIDWTSGQLDLLREQLPPLAELAVATPLAKLVSAAQRDLEAQSGRSSGVAELATKFGGRAVEDFSAKGFGGEALSLAELKDQVTVLHFWDYRDEPLKEPYGQVGYLDFIYHRRKPAGLRVYGVAVDGRLADDKTRGVAERSVRKLKEFMNLSYPVLLDGGSLIKQFGDPRVVGATLPLYVVIGPDQKIIHYHVGHYEVHQDQGLKELDQVIAEALGKK